MQDGGVSKLLQDVEIPRMFRARQSFPEAAILPQDLPQVIFAELSKPEIAGQIKPGLRIAITAGSRGIAKIMRESGFNGWVSLEFEGKADPLTAIPESLTILRQAFA